MVLRQGCPQTRLTALVFHCILLLAGAALHERCSRTLLPAIPSCQQSLWSGLFAVASRPQPARSEQSPAAPDREACSGSPPVASSDHVARDNSLSVAAGGTVVAAGSCLASIHRFYSNVNIGCIFEARTYFVAGSDI